MGARLLERLDYVKIAPRRILDAGSGPARETQALARRYRGAQVVALDFALPMLPRRGPIDRWLGRGVIPVCGDFQRLPFAAASVELVWCNLALHWVSDPLAAFREFDRVLAPEGLILFSTLGPDTLKELRAAAGATRVHEFVDMHDLGDMLLHAGFADPVMDQETLTLNWASPQALLDELRSLGGNVSPQRPAGLRTPRWRARLEREFDALRGPDGRLSLRFEIAYGHAFKAAPRLQAGAPTTVSLDDMRALVRSGAAKR